MSIGLIGCKLGMTRIFTKDGGATSVTVIKVESNRISQLKTIEIDGYNAIQVTSGKRKLSRTSKSEAGHYYKCKSNAGTKVSEFRVDVIDQYELGNTVNIDIFKVGQLIDISGVTKGKGFSGAMKRYGFRGGDATHGNSISHRSLGSIGQCQTPGRVFKNKKMSGHMGNVKCTIQNLTVIDIDMQRSLLLVKGSVPGAQGSNIIIRPAVKD